MTKFRGCIDIHRGVVKQIVGGTLSDASPTALKTNYTSPHPASHYAELYRTHSVTGCHVILLGPGCEEAATSALAAWPGALQVGGGVNGGNAAEWVRRGAAQVVVTSWLFPGGRFDMGRLEEVGREVGRERVVVDLSCRRREGRWVVAMDRWQTMTDMEVNKETLDMLSDYCAEFLIHAADVEGLCKGIDEELVEALGKWVTIPTTYAGGAYSIADLETVERLSGGKVDLTYGSALDIFGGDKVKFEDCVEWNRKKDAEVAV
ncbi:uncharacterized protein LAJ45_07885 [Morchella importuna]|uniref:1-(5-phosphoribosyl)-5-[(5-phosphoribosylamino)methylideneamino] imidazole-4-carboxamide isomerase n=1 Tax=Morchella conica CCBAS932 TaxID=1392247 RepID=A0A3N4KPT5_9PEZI|nr:uncharacterized protein LAJ45_07885 [Morchella importuna]KAH8148121.1 hypothetical protein LAJ45_07885 [Morchella importuna]RPB11439.1 Phosphoribosylformimino-5-aminoimidazole carboxamide ribotide isomerase [Morchella conica CCBAS932]